MSIALSEEELSYYLHRIGELPLEQQVEINDMLAAAEEEKKYTAARANFMPFVKAVWPQFIEGRHHVVMAKTFEEVAAGTLKRVIITLPPRHTKSMFASYLFPSWYFGKFPDRKIIQCSHTSELAIGFGRQVRNLIAGEVYQKVFPDVSLRADSKAAGRWSTNKSGDYYAIGVGGSVTGRGADVLIIDDVHSEQEAMSGNSDAWDLAYEWYGSGPRQRLQPGGSILIVMTRWSKRDLVGRLIKDSIEREGVDSWKIIDFPAILPSGKALWGEYWPLEELEKLKAELPAWKWDAQYQQNPTGREGSIVKKEWWRIWTKEEPPVCEYVITSIDPAFTKSTSADPSAMTTWGVFYVTSEEGKRVPHVILLDAFTKRVEFVELKRLVKETYDRWKPDSLIVEAKASGLPLIHELRATGVPVSEYCPSRGNDKSVRLNAVSDLFRSGFVHAPERRWAEEVIDQVADFPRGDADDLVDCSTMALLRFRQGGFIRSSSDEDDEAKPKLRKAIQYY